MLIHYIILILSCDEITNKEEKNNKSKNYVNGLLTNGGPSTSVFQKSIGMEKTDSLFKEILFGTK